MALKTTQEAIESLPLFQAARRTDPRTSAAAAARATEFKGDHARRILEALAAGPAGQTEIARRTGLTVAQVSKRLHELRKVEAIERTGREVASGENEYRKTAASA